MARARPFNLTAQINLRGPANLRTVVASMRRQLGTISANVNVNIAGGASRSITGLNTRLTRLNTTLAATRTNVNDVTNAINAMAAAMRGMPTIPPIVPPNLPRATRDLNAVTTGMEEFGRQTGLAIRRFAAFSVGAAGIYGLINAANEGIKSFIVFNKEMTRLQQVTGESQNSLKKVSDEITLLSTSLGVASDDLLNVATTLAQAGLSAKDTEKALKALALSALAPSFDDMNSTVEGSIALMKQFGIGAGDLEGALGSINAVAAKFAVEAGDIIAAIQRTGGVFASASKGVSEGTDALNEFISIFTSVRATTRESAETIATGLRTIFTRIQRASTIEALKEFGITLTDAEGKFVGAYKAVQLLSDGLNRLDPRNLKFSEIVEELGGFRQIGKVIPLIQQFTTAQQALAVAQKGAGSLAEDAATAQLSLANQISKVREEFFALFRGIGSSDSFQVMAKATLELASGLIKLADAAKGVLPIVGTILALRGIQGTGQFLRGFRGGIRPGGGRAAANGGIIGYARGGSVPAMVSNGEAFVPPETAKKIGYGKLKRMNQADRNKSARYSKGGGISIFKGPGSGTSDSIGPINLPVGSFIIREKATKALGYSRGGNVQRFVGGSTGPKGVKQKRMSLEDQIREGLDGGTTARSKAPYKKTRQIYNFGVAALRPGTQEEGPITATTAGQLSSTFSQPFKIPGNPKKGIPGRIGKFSIGTLSTIGLDNEIESILKDNFIRSVKRAAKILSNQIGSKPRRGEAFINKVLKGSGFQSVIGSGLEAALALSGSPYMDKTEKTKMFDFPRGLGSVSSLFGIPGNIPTDATRTIGGFGKNRSTMIDAARRFVDAIENQEFTKAEQQIGSKNFTSKNIQSLLASRIARIQKKKAMTSQQIADAFNSSAQSYPELAIGQTGIIPTIKASDVDAVLKGGKATGALQKLGKRGLPAVKRIFKQIQNQKNGGIIQNFANGDYVEGSALKTLKQLTRDFLMPKSRKGGQRKISFIGQKAVPISKNISPELLKEIQAEGRLVSGTGIGLLAKGEQGLIVDKIINVALAKQKKQKEGSLKKTQGALTFSAAGLQRGPRAPKGQMEKALAKYQQDPEYRKAIGLGGSSNVLQALSAFRKSGGQTSLAGVFSDSSVSKIEAGLPKYIASLGDEPQKIAKAKLTQQYLKSFTSGTLASKPGHATAFSETINQMIKTGIVQELASGGYISGFANGGLNKGLSTNRAKEAILGKQLNGMEMVKAATKMGYKLSERDDGLIEFIKSGKIIHTLSRKEASQLLGSLTTGSYKVGGEVPIMAQKGEYVINKRSAQSIGYGNLHKLNKYHTGGVVGNSPQKLAGGGILGAIGSIPANILRLLQSLPTVFSRLGPALRGFSDSAGRFIATIGRLAPSTGGFSGLRGRAVAMRDAGLNRAQRRAAIEGQQTRGGMQNSAFALSMALPVINEMIQGNQEPTSAAEASNRAFGGSLATGAGGALALASMGGVAGPIGAVVVGLGSFVKAIADSQNAIREFNIKDATDKLNNQIESTSKSLDKFDKDINNANTRTKALADVLSTISKAESVITASQDKRVGVFNLGDTGEGSFERSVILFDRGISDYLQTLSFFSDAENARANEAALFAKSIPKLAKERAAGFGGASEASTRLLETEIKRSGSLDALKANDTEFKKLTNSLALADVEVQEQILRVRNNNNLDANQKKKITEGIIARAGENKAIEIANRAMREKAIDELNKAANKATFSLELMFTEMEQSIAKSNFAIDKLKESSDLAAAALSGQAKIGQTRLDAINILQNPRAYSGQENNAAASLGASAFGADLEPAIKGLLRFGPSLQDTVMSTINQVLTSTPKEELNNEVIANKISRAVRQSLDRLQLPPELSAKLSNEVGKQIEELRKSGEDKVDFSELAERIPALSKVVESARRAQETAIQSLENWQRSLNTYSDAFNRITELQIQNNERLRRSSDVLYQGQLELAKAFGQPTDLMGAINNFNASIASMSGGFTSVGDILQEIQKLEGIRQQQQNLQNDAGNRGEQGTQAFMTMTNNLKNTNIKLRESYSALEQLSQSSEIAAAAMNRIAELQQKQQAGIGVMEKLVTSTPDELRSFSNALQRLQVNMMGGSNFGTTAEQRSESLQAFNMIAPLLDGAEGALKANVLESMLREANAPLTPFFGQILDSLRNPAADPQMKQAIDIYQASLQQQIAANAALNALNNTTIKENADFAAQQIVAGFGGVMKDFQSRQLQNIADGINSLVNIFKNRPPVAPAAGKALGGMIYANNGMFVPKGTDTVPAMLTPGEFVVNRQATQKNLPLLKSINNGSKGYSRGGTAYLAKGGLVSIYDNTGNAIGGKDYKPTKDISNVQTSETLFDIPRDFDFSKSINYDNVKGIIPAYYSSAVAQTNNLKPNRSSGWTGNISEQINETNKLLSGGNIVVRAATEAPKTISGNLEDDVKSQKVDAITKSIDHSFWLPSPIAIDKLKKSEESIIRGIDAADLNHKLNHYKVMYDYFIKTLNQNKYHQDHIENNSKKIFNHEKLPALNTTATSTGKTIKLNNLSTKQSNFIGPILDSATASGDVINSKSPLGWAIATDAYDRFNLVAGTENMVPYSITTGFQGTSVGNNMYGNGIDIQDFINEQTGSAYNFIKLLYETVPEIIKSSKNSLDKLKSIQIVPSEENKRGELLQKRLNTLYNNQKFVDTFEPPDIAGTDRISLYNIRDEKAWNKILSQTEKEKIKDIKPGENIATNKASWYKLLSDPIGGGIAQLPWTKGFSIDSDILKATEEKFKKSQDFIKESKLETYKDKGLMFNYQKIKGYLFDQEEGAFDTSYLAEFISVPFGGKSFAQNPFTGLSESNSKFGYFENIARLNNFIDSILQETTKKSPKDSIDVDTILKANDISTFGTFPPLTAENAYLKSNGRLFEEMSLDRFIEEYNKSRRLRELDQGFKVPGLGVGPAGPLFDLLKTQENLLNISSNTLRSPDIVRIGGGLGYRLSSLKNPNQLPAYVEYLNYLVNKINNDRRSGKVINYRGGSYTKYNENFANLYSMAESTREAFSSISSNDIGGLSQLIGTDASSLVRNGVLQQGSVQKIIDSIKNRAERRKQAILTGGALNPILSQKTTAFDDFLKTDRESAEIAEIDASGAILGYKKATEQNAAQKTIQQVGALAFNPYNFFKGDSRKNLINNSVIKAIDDQIRRYRANKRTPRDLLAKTYGVKSDVSIVRDWFSNIHDKIFNFDLTEDMIKGNDIADLKNMIDDGLGGKLPGFDSPLFSLASAGFDLSNQALSRLTGGTFKLGNGPPTPLLDFDKILDLLIARKNIKIKQEAAATPPAVGKANGGLIYASNGTLVNFQPRGTDTVPAMLTPGEFVVNRKATQQNLPLLKSINNGAKGYSKGGVAYLAGGGIAEQISREAKPQLSQYYGSQLAELQDKWFISKDGGANVSLANGIGTTQLLNDKKEPNFPTTKFLDNIKQGKYALIQALDANDAKNIAQNTPAYQALDFKIEKLIPAQKILRKFIDQKNKKDQKFYNIYQRELTIAPNLFEKSDKFQQGSSAAFSDKPEEQAINDKFKEYIKDNNKKAKILLDLHDRKNWLDLIIRNNTAAKLQLDTEQNIAGNVGLENQYERLSKIADYQAVFATSEKRGIEKLLVANYMQPVTTPPANRFSKSVLFNLQDPVLKNSLQKIVQANQYNNGGMIYANKGRLINFQPKGSDTVPAMLTPGEFVVNKQATQQNLPLLQNINNGAQGYSNGGVVYLASGGRTYERQRAAFARQKELQEAKRREYEEMMRARRESIAADKAQRQLRSTGAFSYEGNRSTARPQGPVPVPAAQQPNTKNNAQNINKADEFLTNFSKKIDLFGNYVQKLADLKIPDKIEMNIVTQPIEVVITGSAALESMSEGIQQMIASQINQKMGQLWSQTDGALGNNPATSQSGTY